MNAGDPNIPVGGTTPQPRGFGHSKRRMWVEIALMLGGIAGLAVGAIWLAGAAASLLLPLVSHEVDIALGKQAWVSAGLSTSRCTDEGPVRYVERLSEPMLKALGQTPYEFQFQVVASPEVNAFALPGGFITVNMGLLEKAESGEEVAAVIAHELQHVLLRHGTQRMLRRMGGTVVMSLIFGGTGVEYPAYLLSELTSLSYDRDEELEADQQGLQLMQTARLDPIGMKSFFERLAKQGGPTPPALLSTHPDPGQRASEAERASKEGGPFEALPPPRNLVCNPPEPSAP